jgi:hypothetical protein
VYFDSSPAQAGRLNKALALSPLYSAVVEVAKTRAIDKARLLGLPGSQSLSWFALTDGARCSSTSTAR